MRTTHMAFGILCGVAALLGGCGHYYKVNDPAGQKVYYTTEIDQSRAGAITFKDKKSGSKVTLQSSEIKEISEDEFNAGIKAPAPAPAKATPAPAPAAAAPAEAPAQPADTK